LAKKHLAISADTADTADLEIAEVLREKAGLLRTRFARCVPEITTETNGGDGDLGGVAPRTRKWRPMPAKNYWQTWQRRKIPTFF